MNSKVDTKKEFFELVRYGLAGVAATVVNIISYWFFSDLLGVQYLAANVIAWILAFIVAFVSNKLWVFESKEWGTAKSRKEFVGFLGARLATLVIDMFLIWLLVGVMGLGSIVSKVIDNVVVIAVNWAASKFFIFKKN